MILYASPTFLFRDRCPDHMEEIMKRLRGCGFDGIELFGMFGLTKERILTLSREYGLHIVCDHIPYEELSENTEACVSARAALGCRYLTVDRIPETLLPGRPGWSETVREIHRIGMVCRDQGMQLLYHSHGYDLTRKAGNVPVLDRILEDTDPELLKFQPDLGWISLGGGDPAAYLDRWADRCPVIHLKDYYADGSILLDSPFVLGEKRGGEAFHHFEFRPSGYGVMNYAALMPRILRCRPEWITTDHDMSYERDTFTDMAMSLRYVKELAALYPQED